MKVFVSGTVTDLAAYREAARRVLQALGLEFLGLETFSASDLPPIEKSLREVDRADLFLLLVGQLYGYVPPGYQRSVTELEYKRARDSSKPILALLLSDDVVQVDKVDPDPKARERLTAFKRELAQQQVVKYFRTPTDLEAELAAALHVYIRVVKSLENPAYEWRTVEGVSRELGIDEKNAAEIVESLPNLVIRSRVPDQRGRQLYATRRHYQRTQSPLDRLRDLLTST